MRARSLFFTAIVALGGCAPTSMTVPNCPNPVFLGPVDRVGGHRAAKDAKMVGTVEGEVSDDVTVSTSRTGNTQVTTVTRWSAQSLELGQQVVERTEGRPDRDVRIEALGGGAWMYFFGGYGWASRWANVRGRVVEVGHGL